MTQKHLIDNHDKSWLNSVNAEERCLSAFILISLNKGHTGPSFTDLNPCSAVPLYPPRAQDGPEGSRVQWYQGTRVEFLYYDFTDLKFLKNFVFLCNM